MAADAPLSVLWAADPAVRLAPLAERERLTLLDEAMSDPRESGRRPPHFARRAARVAVAVALLAALTTGIGWAAGVFKLSPRALFETNPQGALSAGHGFRGIWDQKVIPGSVKKVASVEIPKVGPVAFWNARTEQGGWCAALRLRNGDWLGIPPAAGGSPLGGGVVPGCFATAKQLYKAKQGPAANGFDCLQNAIDARGLGEFWQIRYGRITAPGAVRVRDLTSGASTNVVHGDLFILAIRHPARRLLILRPVAYDSAGSVVARGCPGFGGH
jgi:hypothetical protein